MKKNYKIIITLIVLVTIMCVLNAMISNSSKKTVSKLLDKDKVSCGYYKQNNKFTYYLYDGTAIYNTDSASCMKLKNKNNVDSIIVIDDSKKIDRAIVNAIGDDDNWYGEVTNASKRIDKIKY